MTIPSLILRRGFGFPGNFAPGFNPNHPVFKSSPVAGQNAMLLSAIPVLGNYVNLLTGSSGGILAGSAATGKTIDGNLGPVDVFTQAGFTFPDLVTCPPLMTFWGFIRPTTLNGATLLCTTTTTGGLSFLINNVTNVLNLQMNGASGAPSTIAISLGVPYFLAASCKVDVTASYRFSYFALRLDTGQAFTSQVTSSQGAIGAFTPAQSGTCIVGSGPTLGQAVVGNMGPVGMCPGYALASSLKAWFGSDPWAIAYPTTALQVGFDAEMVGNNSGSPPPAITPLRSLLGIGL